MSVPKIIQEKGSFVEYCRNPLFICRLREIVALVRELVGKQSVGWDCPRVLSYLISIQ